MRLSLVPRAMIDNAGNAMAVRMTEDFRQHGINAGSLTQKQISRFKDLGLVEYDGQEYYASIYDPPEIEDEP